MRRFTINKKKCLPCLMKDQVWSENSLSIYDLFSYCLHDSLCHILSALSYILLIRKCDYNVYALQFLSRIGQVKYDILINVDKTNY
jgi:hypothetical protein